MNHIDTQIINRDAVFCSNVVKAFGRDETRTQALNGVNFSARLGEMTFVIGPSGCGKTTLLSIITGVLAADLGHVEVLGTSLAELKGTMLPRFRGENIGLVLQQFNLLPALNLVENVAIPLILQGVREREANERSIRLLEELGLAHHLPKHPYELSVGQQQRVAVARALIHEPRLIVCDEPTAALDAETWLKVMHLLRETVLSPERAIIVVTHDDRIEPFADRIAYMIDGRIEQVVGCDQYERVL